MDHVAALECPALFVAARHEDMVPLAYVEEAYARAGSVEKELEVIDCGHFDLYLGPHYERNARAQADFLEKHLRGRPATPS